jgi:hypothetical protein
VRLLNKISQPLQQMLASTLPVYLVVLNPNRLSRTMPRLRIRIIMLPRINMEMVPRSRLKYRSSRLSRFRILWLNLLNSANNESTFCFLMLSSSTSLQKLERAFCMELLARDCLHCIWVGVGGGCCISYAINT